MNISEHQELSWRSISIYHSEVENILTTVVAPLTIEKLQSDEKLVFNRSQERGDNLILMVREQENKFSLTNKLNNSLKSFLADYPSEEKFIKKPVFDWFLPFPVNHIELNNEFLFDIIETGGLQASFLAQDVLSDTSKLLIEKYSSEGKTDPEDEIGLALQLQLAIATSVFKQKEVPYFFNFISNDLFDNLSIDEKEKNTILRGLNTNYQSQKEIIDPYINAIQEAFYDEIDFEEEPINQFKTKLKEINGKLIDLIQERRFFAPETFEINTKIPVQKSVQELFPVIEYWCRAINSQMGIKDGLELNLQYILNQATS